MSNTFKDINIKNCRYSFVNDIINQKNFDPNNIKIDEKSYKNIFVYYIGYVTIKDSKYIKINSVNYLYLIFSKVNGYFEEINANRCLTLVKTKKKIKKYEELWSETGDLIMLISKNQKVMMKNL